jgi:hypothetical protein
MEQEKRYTQVVDELQKGDACRIDLSCPEPGAGLDRLRGALKFRGVSFLFDYDARARKDVPIPHTSYVLFVENVKIEDILALLNEITPNGELKPKSKGRGPAGFDKASVKTMTAEDRDQFANVLGLPSSTIERHMRGESSASVPAGKAAEKVGSDPAAIVVADPESNSEPRPATRPLSPHIQHFFESGHTRRDGSLSVLIFLKVGREEGRR